MLDKTYQEFQNRILKKIDKKNIFTDKIHTLVYGTDASFYRLIPKIVVLANNANEVQFLIKEAYALNLAMTFRGGGTSLSGQALSDSILIMTSRDFTKFSLSKDKSYIALEPALTGEQVNNILKFHGKKIGPDPASINAAMIGGIAANNASGMCCGIEQNSYQTLKSLKLIMADGQRLDTKDQTSKENFLRNNLSFMQALEKLSNDTKNDEEFAAFCELEEEVGDEVDPQYNDD